MIFFIKVAILQRKELQTVFKEYSNQIKYHIHCDIEKQIGYYQMYVQVLQILV